MSESSKGSEPNMELWIEVHGQKLPEYCEKVFEKEGSIVMSCWIASQPGKAFSICGECRNFTFISDVFINGLLVDSSSHLSSQGSRTWKLEKTNNGRTYKNLEFSTVDLTGESAVCKHTSVLRSQHLIQTKRHLQHRRRSEY
ncbi:hypothetical protein JB92DRAFT_881299 [Gautieria morchelliformis]|nr:hypothetical protein JB92DRAFT_881299 [Gautieria morchelliformis]